MFALNLDRATEVFYLTSDGNLNNSMANTVYI